jgi:hypothetical protein
LSASLGRLLAGAAAVEVTPAPGAWLAGYGRNRRAVGAHDPLWARALALSVGQTTAVIISVDCLGLRLAPCDAVAAAFDLPREAVILCATHTHSGPDTIGLWGPDETASGLDPAILATLIAGAQTAGRLALAALRPARLTLATAHAPARCAVNVRDPASLDSEISVMHLTDPAGSGLATLVNWACHPETLRSASVLYSSDFADPLRRGVEAALGGVTVFVNGALGAMVTVDAAEDTFDEAARIGQAVADEAVSAVRAEIDHTDWLTFAVAGEEVALPLANRDLAASVGTDPSAAVTTRISALSLGNAALVTAPGELQPALGRRWKRLMQRPHRFLAGLANDELGYILRRDDFASSRYAYERTMSPGPETAARLTTAAQRVVRGVMG